MSLYSRVLQQHRARRRDTAGEKLKVKTLLHQCPYCKTGTLITVEIFGKRGPQKKYLLEKQMVPVG